MFENRTAENILKWWRIWTATTIGGFLLVFAVASLPFVIPRSMSFLLSTFFTSMAFLLLGATGVFNMQRYFKHVKLIKRWRKAYSLNEFPVSQEIRKELKSWVAKQLFHTIDVAIRKFCMRDNARAFFEKFQVENPRPSFANVCKEFRSRTGDIVAPWSWEELREELVKLQNEYDAQISKHRKAWTEKEREAEEYWKWTQNIYDLFQGMETLPDDPSTGKPYTNLTKLLSDREKELTKEATLEKPIEEPLRT